MDLLEDMGETNGVVADIALISIIRLVRPVLPAISTIEDTCFEIPFCQDMPVNAARQLRERCLRYDARLASQVRDAIGAEIGQVLRA